MTLFIKKTFPVGMLACNCSIIGNKATGKGLVFDPGGDPERIISTVEQLKLNIIALICTHAHFDHFLAAEILRKKWGAPIYLHPDDTFLWDMLEAQCKLFNIPYQPVGRPDYWLKDEAILPCCDGVVLHTPGHTPGSTSFLFEQENVLIAGDTLFQGAVGRTDLWGGDYDQLEHSVRHKIYTLKEETEVITGHGPCTTIGQEKAHNAFFRG